MKYLFKSDGSCAVKRTTGIHRGSNAAAVILIGFCDDNETEATADNIGDLIGIAKETLVVELCITYPDNSQSGWMSVRPGGNAPLRYFYPLQKQDALVEGTGKINIRWYDSAQVSTDADGNFTDESVLHVSDDVTLIINGGVIAQSPFLSDEEISPLAAALAELGTNAMRCYDASKIDNYAVDYVPDGKKHGHTAYYNATFDVEGQSHTGMLFVTAVKISDTAYKQFEYFYSDGYCYSRVLTIEAYETSSPVVLEKTEFLNVSEFVNSAIDAAKLAIEAAKRAETSAVRSENAAARAETAADRAESVKTEVEVAVDNAKADISTAADETKADVKAIAEAAKADVKNTADAVKTEIDTAVGIAEAAKEIAVKKSEDAREYAESAATSAGDASQSVAAAKNYANAAKGSAIDAETSARNAAKAAEEALATTDNFYTKVEIDAGVAKTLDISVDPETFIIGLVLKSGDGTILSSHQIDLPMESVVVGGEYDNASQAIILTLQGGQKITIPVGDLIDGFANQEEIEKIIDGRIPVAKASSADDAVNADNADNAAIAQKVSHPLTLVVDGQPISYDGSMPYTVKIKTPSDAEENAVFFTPQSLTDDQKSQARANIDAQVTGDYALKAGTYPNLGAGKDGNGNNIENTYVKKTGDVMTGSLGVDTINGATLENAMLRQLTNNGNIVVGSTLQHLRLVGNEVRPKYSNSDVNETTYSELALASDLSPYAQKDESVLLEGDQTINGKKMFANNVLIYDSDLSTYLDLGKSETTGIEFHIDDNSIDYDATIQCVSGSNPTKTPGGGKLAYRARSGHEFSGTIESDDSIITKGLFQCTANGKTSKLGQQNGSWCHFETEAESGFYFGNSLHVNGNVGAYINGGGAKTVFNKNGEVFDNGQRVYSPNNPPDYVRDYGNDSSKIYIGYYGNSVNKDDFLQFAAYINYNGTYAIKDMSAVEAKKVLGLDYYYSPDNKPKLKGTISTGSITAAWNSYINGDGDHPTFFTFWTDETAQRGVLQIFAELSNGTGGSSMVAQARGEDKYWGPNTLCVSAMIPRGYRVVVMGSNIGTVSYSKLVLDM